MTKVTREDVKKATLEIGVKEGDILLCHSSYKSLGEVEGGAETVISGFLDALGKSGTLVFPTFCQKDWPNVYKTWHMDKPSDTGYLTNYFRLREGSVRSDQATHSVAACGEKAKWLTENHGHTSKRFGDMGDTPFSPDSPWEKMYNENARVLLLGIDALSITFRHYAEYVFIEKCLKNLEGTDKYEEMKAKLHHFEYSDKLHPWPRTYNIWLFEQLEKMGKTTSAKCGDATFLSVLAKDFVDFTIECLEKGEKEALWVIEEAWDINEYIAWYDEYRNIIG